MFLGKQQSMWPEGSGEEPWKDEDWTGFHHVGRRGEDSFRVNSWTKVYRKCDEQWQNHTYEVKHSLEYNDKIDFKDKWKWNKNIL